MTYCLIICSIFQWFFKFVQTIKIPVEEGIDPAPEGVEPAAEATEEAMAAMVTEAATGTAAETGSTAETGRTAATGSGAATPTSAATAEREVIFLRGFPIRLFANLGYFF